MSMMRASKIWVWVMAVAVALVAVAACDRPVTSTDYFDRGDARLKEGGYKGAIADFDQVIRLQPDNAYAYRNRGFAKVILGQNQGAIADLKVALALAQSTGRRDLAAETEEMIQIVEQE